MKNNNPFYWVAIITAFVSFLGIIVDKPHIDPNIFDFYKYGRILFGVNSLVLLFLYHQNKISLSSAAEVALINLMFYSIHGQLFVPCYYLGYIESLLIITLYFPLRKKNLYAIMGLATPLMVLAIITVGLPWFFDARSYAA